MFGNDLMILCNLNYDNFFNVLSLSSFFFG